MAQDGWGAPRIHAELMKLGFDVSESTVSRYLPRRPSELDQLKRWMAFLRNHKDDIAAMDLFTVPTASLRLLFGFFVIKHGRRHIVHFNATFNPTASWVMQQLREAFPYDTAPRYLIFDRDAIFSPAVVECVRSFGIELIRISYRSPWQNGTAERWILSCRRELLEHVVVFGERHLVRLMRSYICYYHEDRGHLGLEKDTPNKRPVNPRPSPTAKVVALPRVGGLHHRYEWRDAAQGNVRCQPLPNLITSPTSYSNVWSRGSFRPENGSHSAFLAEPHRPLISFGSIMTRDMLNYYYRKAA